MCGAITKPVFDMKISINLYIDVDFGPVSLFLYLLLFLSRFDIILIVLILSSPSIFQ